MCVYYRIYCVVCLRTEFSRGSSGKVDHLYCLPNICLLISMVTSKLVRMTLVIMTELAAADLYSFRETT